MLGELVFIGMVASFIHAGKKSAKRAKEREEEDKRRRETPCRFNNGISREQFAFIVRKSTKKLRRLSSLEIDGPIIYGTVRSNSGLSEWDFKIDFNDYGNITGNYWIKTENYDSSVPYHIAKNIKSMIETFPDCLDEISTNEKELDDYGKEKCPYDAAKWKHLEKNIKIISASAI